MQIPGLIFSCRRKLRLANMIRKLRVQWMDGKSGCEERIGVWAYGRMGVLALRA